MSLHNEINKLMKARAARRAAVRVEVPAVTRHARLAALLEKRRGGATLTTRQARVVEILDRAELARLGLA